MKIPIEEIKFNEDNRIRKDLGDLDNLKESMKNFGLLQPIIIDSNFNLIAGMRRLTAARSLGWKEIEVQQFNVDGKANLLQIEADENTTRLDFTWQEKERIKSLTKRYNRKSIWGKIWALIIDYWERLFKKK